MQCATGSELQAVQRGKTQTISPHCIMSGAKQNKPQLLVIKITYSQVEPIYLNTIRVSLSRDRTVFQETFHRTMNRNVFSQSFLIPEPGFTEATLIDQSKRVWPLKLLVADYACMLTV